MKDNGCIACIFMYGFALRIFSNAFIGLHFVAMHCTISSYVMCVELRLLALHSFEVYSVYRFALLALPCIYFWCSFLSLLKMIVRLLSSWITCVGQLTYGIERSVRYDRHHRTTRVQRKRFRHVGVPCFVSDLSCRVYFSELKYIELHFCALSCTVFCGIISVSLCNFDIAVHYFLYGYCGRFGRGASLCRHRSQLFGRLWVRLPLPTRQFSEI